MHLTHLPNPATPDRSACGADALKASLTHSMFCEHSTAHATTKQATVYTVFDTVDNDNGTGVANISSTNRDTVPRCTSSQSWIFLLQVLKIYLKCGMYPSCVKFE